MGHVKYVNHTSLTICGDFNISALIRPQSSSSSSSAKVNVFTIPTQAAFTMCCQKFLRYQLNQLLPHSGFYFSKNSSCLRSATVLCLDPLVSWWVITITSRDLQSHLNNSNHYTDLKGLKSCFLSTVWKYSDGSNSYVSTWLFINKVVTSSLICVLFRLHLCVPAKVFK